MTKLAVSNATNEAVTVYLIFGKSGPVCPNPVGVGDFPFLSPVPNSPLQGTFTLAAGATQEFDPKGRCFTGNVGFFITPQCPVPGADFNHGKEGTNIGEFTLNVTQGDEAFDISCVNGVNCWMNMSVTGSGWYYGPNNTSINSIENKALQQNQGNPGVYPVNCTDCIQLVGNPPCPSLPIGPPQTERICNIQRTVQPSSNDTLTITLKEGNTEGNTRNVKLKCLGNVDGPRFLDGRTREGTVGLAPSTDANFSGTKWELNDLGNNVVTLKCLGNVDGPRFLDGRTREGAVGLAPNTDANFSGTKWQMDDF